MGSLALLALCLLLLRTASPLRDIQEAAATTTSSCSSQLQEDHHRQHLNSSGLHLTLHHVRSPCSPVSLPELSSHDILTQDELRVQSLAARLSSSEKKKTKGSAAGGDFTPETLRVPLKPGISLGVGNYIANVGLGTPARDYIMVVDTGSSLTWLQCKPCRVSCHEQVGPIFDPAASRTYKAVSCSSPECTALQSATLNPSACSSSNVCIYEASYGDSSFSLGYLSKDTLSFGASPALPGFVYGCGQDNEGLFGRSAGLIGLARNKLSMLSQLAPKYGNAFSYCLPSTASTGYLFIGANDKAKFSFTPMVTKPLDPTLYFLNFVGMTVGQKPLAVSAAAYKGLPTIIDSGTVITRLPPAVYSALSEAVVGALSKYPRAPAYSILDTCFKGSAGSLAVPKVRMLFAGGAVLDLSAHNVFYDVTSTTTCLAFARAGSVAIIGNRQQQTFAVLYDVSGSKIGFSAGGCG
ncbi:hypothetical protein Taro_011475 [Colocasia esculenta]|uniref:Peptidase A1 domain-containing protein n=1 Tax=Colocasia esculenta TaxID=4460 RepID=A0A843UCT1_COLES|nr:hypothetical protein [Colocasia esculenta]